jgi:menaquinone-dependent protoporphyrinogen oxidase
MKNLILFASQHGCAEKCAISLKAKLHGETTLCRIGKNKIPELDGFDQIIIGGSIHRGNIQIKLQHFMADHGFSLMTKRIGLYLCCMYEGDVAKEQFNNAFPDVLRSEAVTQSIFGGEFDFDKMNIFERLFTRGIAGIKTSTSNLKQFEIDKFADEMNRHP